MHTFRTTRPRRRILRGLLVLSVTIATMNGAWPTTSQADTINPRVYRAYTGDRMTLFGDVTGDGRMDVVAVNNDGLFVSRATGNVVAPYARPVRWTDIGYWGDRGTVLADVTGDGKADAIVLNDDFTVVRASTGTAFAPNQIWDTALPTGTVFADVTHDGKADGLYVDRSGVSYFRSLGSRFDYREDLIDIRPTAPPSARYLPNRPAFTTFADVDRDGWTDLVAQDDRGGNDWTATVYDRAVTNGHVLTNGRYPCAPTGCVLYDFARISTTNAWLDRVVVEPTTNTIGFVSTSSPSTGVFARWSICDARWPHAWGEWDGDGDDDFVEATPTRIIVHRNNSTSFTTPVTCPAVPAAWIGLQ